MTPIYQSCTTDPDRKGIVKRSLSRIEEHLSTAGKRSPFHKVARDVTQKLSETDKKHMRTEVQKRVDQVLLRLKEAIGQLLDDAEMDEEEADARQALQELLPELISDVEEASKDLKAVKAEYGA